MNKKIIYWALVGLGGVNLFLLLSGVIIPWVISTDKLPLLAIVFLVTTIVTAIVTAICCVVYRMAKKQDSATLTIPPGASVEIECIGGGGGGGVKTAKVKIKPNDLKEGVHPVTIGEGDKK